MGSVQGESRCANCGGAVWYDFRHHTGEESGQCRRCGLWFDHHFKLDGDGMPVRDEAGRYVYETRRGGGYGMVRIDTAYSGARIEHAFTAPPTEDVVREFLDLAQRVGNPETTYLTVHDRTSGQSSCRLGIMPPNGPDGEWDEHHLTRLSDGEDGGA